MKQKKPENQITTGHACGGFTLLEILVALMLLTVSLVAILELYSANLRGIAKADDYSHAVILAESRMREILDDEALSEQTSTDTTDDGYRIDTVVSSTARERTENLQVSLFEIDLTVSWTKDAKPQAVTLKTLKIVRKKV